jgi:dihydrofolate reductase
MGRKMFAGVGPWDPNWNGWWGEDPPFHMPVFVLTHNQRQPQPMQGGTTFTFVNDGIESALKQARAVAGDKKIAIAGGADTVAQFLRAGLLDELYLHIAPVILGSGERLLDNIGEPRLQIIKAVNSPTVTHIHYRILH